MSITVKEIANLAGVSRGTVDRALKGRDGINPETKKKILDIAKKHSYTPNLIGKALVYSGHTIKIQVILNSLGNTFFDDIKKGIEAARQEFSSYGFETQLVEFKGYNPEQLLEILEHIEPDVKNIILTPIKSKRVEEKIKSLTKSGINVITISSDINPDARLAYVGCDYLKSGKTAGRLVGLLSGGKANLCITTGTTVHTGHRARIEGIKAMVADEYEGIKIVDIIENQDDTNTAYVNMKNMLEKHREIDFICITAGGVRGTIRAVKECGRKIKVCSFDDTVTTREALLSGYILATICQQPFEQGYNAVRLIFDAAIVKKEVPSINYSQLYIKLDQSL